MKGILGKTSNELPKEKEHKNFIAYQNIKSNSDYRKYMINEGMKNMDQYRKNM